MLLLIPHDGVQQSQVWDRVVPLLMVSIIQADFSAYHTEAMYQSSWEIQNSSVEACPFRNRTNMVGHQPTEG